MMTAGQPSAMAKFDDTMKASGFVQHKQRSSLSGCWIMSKVKIVPDQQRHWMINAAGKAFDDETRKSCRQATPAGWDIKQCLKQHRPSHNSVGEGKYLQRCTI